MTKIILSGIFALLFLFGNSQKNKHNPGGEIKIPMTAESWVFSAASVEFVQHRSVESMRILKTTDQTVLKDFNFVDGTIEYDLESEDRNFAHLYFRRESKENNEHFFLRVYRAGDPLGIDAVQYAPFINGASLWNLMDYYQGPASFKKDQWTHVKLVVSGLQMLAYVNDMIHPVLEIPRLEANSKQGGIAFNGMGYIANLVIRPGAVEGLSPNEGIDPARHDSRYLRDWKISQPMDLPIGRELSKEDLPILDSGWQSIQAERRGLVNLSRLFGKSSGRRAIWLKIKLKSAIDQNRRLNFGFCNDAWVFLNAEPVFVDKNIYGTPISKQDGRCSLENAALNLPLKAGINELLIGISNDIFGWAIMARLDSIDGIEFVKD